MAKLVLQLLWYRLLWGSRLPRLQHRILLPPRKISVFKDVKHCTQISYPWQILVIYAEFLVIYITEFLVICVADKFNRNIGKWRGTLSINVPINPQHLTQRSPSQRTQTQSQLLFILPRLWQLSVESLVPLS